MKILIASACAVEHNNIDARALYKEVGIDISLRPDSSLARHTRPFFVPDHLGSIEARAALAARISRLGKSIALRFATRYYDALASALVLTATDMERRLRAEHRPADMASAFDSSVIIGDWTLRENILSPQLRFEGGGSEWISTDDTPLREVIDAAIAEASRLCTLKTGDLVIALADCTPLAVKTGDSFKGWLGGEERLAVEAK